LEWYGVRQYVSQQHVSPFDKRSGAPQVLTGAGDIDISCAAPP
jgi:hypothetical protein